VKKLILAVVLALSVIGAGVAISAVNSPVVSDGGSCNNS